jgi:anti-anti-sigma factor
MAGTFHMTPQSTKNATGANLSVTAQRRHDHVVVAVRGEIDMSNISSFETELAAHAAQPWVVVDMSDVLFCGVAGARLLQQAAIRATATGRRFEVVVSRALARLLNTTGLADGITTSGAVDAKVKHLMGR